jgi:hypothetical protein
MLGSGEPDEEVVRSDEQKEEGRFVDEDANAAWRRQLRTQKRFV